MSFPRRPRRVFGTEAPLSAADMELITADNQYVILRNQEALLHRLTATYDQVRKQLAAKRQELDETRTALKVELHVSKGPRPGPRSPRAAAPSPSADAPGPSFPPISPGKQAEKSPAAPGLEPSSVYFPAGEEPSEMTLVLSAEATAASLGGPQSTQALIRDIRAFQKRTKPVTAEELESMLAQVEHKHTDIAFKNFMWERLLERTGREIVSLQKSGGEMQMHVEALDSGEQHMRGTRRCASRPRLPGDHETPTHTGTGC